MPRKRLAPIKPALLTRARVAELADALASGARTRHRASCLPSMHPLQNQQFSLGLRLPSLVQISHELVTGISAEFRFTPRQSLEAKARKVIIAPVSRERSFRPPATVAPQWGERCDYRNPVDTPKGNHGNQLQRRPQRNHRTSHQELELHRNTTQ